MSTTGCRNWHACMVGMLGEKAEIAEVRCGFGGIFDRADVDGARHIFAGKKNGGSSDGSIRISPELHLCMEVIAIAGLEQQAYDKNLLTVCVVSGI